MKKFEKLEFRLNLKYVLMYRLKNLAKSNLGN